MVAHIQPKEFGQTWKLAILLSSAKKNVRPILSNPRTVLTACDYLKLDSSDRGEVENGECFTKLLFRE